MSALSPFVRALRALNKASAEECDRHPATSPARTLFEGLCGVFTRAATDLEQQIARDLARMKRAEDE